MWPFLDCARRTLISSTEVWDTIAVEDLRPHMTSRIDQQSARIHVVQLDLAYFLWVC